MTEPLLLTPGPTPIQPDAQAALHKPMLGHMDPQVFELNARIQRNLRRMYGAAEGAFTALAAGTGSLGMEAGFANLLEPGDEIVVCTNGEFGERMAEMSERYGARVTRIYAEPGRAVDLEEVRAALASEPKLVAVVHGETSTGVINPAPEIARAAFGRTLVTVDAVTTAGMMEFCMDEWGVDYAYTGSQKCLSAPPGVAPIAVSARALEAVRARKTPVSLWYCDFEGMQAYWDRRQYHHTVPVQLHYALDAALQAALDEGLEARARRTITLNAAVAEALLPLGFSHFVENPRDRLPTVLALRLPAGLEDAPLRAALRERGISITGGLGATAGKIWRLGLMGEAARPEHYRRLFRELAVLLGARDLEERFEARLAGCALSH